MASPDAREMRGGERGSAGDGGPGRKKGMVTVARARLWRWSEGEEPGQRVERHAQVTRRRALSFWL